MNEEDSKINIEKLNPKIALLKFLYENMRSVRAEFEELYLEAYSVLNEANARVKQNQAADTISIRNSATKIYEFTKRVPNFPFLLMYHKIEGEILPQQSIRAVFYSLVLANALDYSKPRGIELAFSGLMADCGMNFIPDSIIKKTSTLSEDETRIIREHPTAGYQYLTKICNLKHSQAYLSLQHHESYDGSGYPSKQKKTDLDEPVFLFSIADSFAALTSNRPWRPAYAPYDAMKMMISVIMSRFELNCLRLFLNKISIYPVGSFVELSDGRRGLVLEANDGKMLRPSVIIPKNNNLNPENVEYINLSLETELAIVKSVDPL